MYVGTYYNVFLRNDSIRFQLCPKQCSVYYSRNQIDVNSISALFFVLCSVFACDGDCSC